MGDPAGIGGEIVLKAAPRLVGKSIPVVIGDLATIRAAGKHLADGESVKFKRFKEGSAGDLEFIDLGLVDAVQWGVVDPKYGEASYRYIMESLKLTFSGETAGIVTCPINKAAIRAAGVPFTGHTELLAHFGGTDRYVMMMMNREVRVSLVTIHISLKSVPSALSADSVYQTISVTRQALVTFFGIREPLIKVCGLNPHAGEQGIMGTEEVLIEEGLTMARSAGIRAEGPFPADTLFHRIDCDAFVAMYHDQGLIPVKTIDFARTVNVTLGLPFIRTSPGHGTGFDIAGKGIADPAGLVEAYKVAEAMAEHF
jgi:4-hydroxythreonine-4-phosphate dehydrogenase